MKSKTEIQNLFSDSPWVRSRFIIWILLLIPVLLLCSCGTVGQYSLVPEGSARSDEESLFIAYEFPAEPFLKLDGHFFQLPATLANWNGGAGYKPRSIQVRLLPGTHNLQVQISYMGYYNVHGFEQGRQITFDAVAGRTYELKVNVGSFDPNILGAKIKWDAKVLENQTGKEFLSTPISQ